MDMSWNRPKAQIVIEKPRSTFKNKWFIGFSAVLILGVCAYFVIPNLSVGVFSSAAKDTNNKIEHNEKKRRTKATGATFVATKGAEKTKSISKPEIADSEVLFKPKVQGRLLVWQIKNPPVFTNQFEGYVADILTLEPGERILDTTLDDEFDKSFKEALEKPIQIGKDDTEDVVALKRAVLETTAEVRKRVLSGERPQDIIVDAMLELNKIADYRDDLQAAFNKYLVTESDPKEIIRYRDEANAILDEYGAQHLEAPEDEEYASEMMITAKEDKIKELTESLEQGEKEETK